MDVTFRRRLVGSNRQKGDLNVCARADFPEAIEVGGVPAVENRSACVFKKKPSESAVAVMKNTCAPMACGSEGDLEGAMLEALPMAQLVDPVKSQIMHEITDVFGDGDGLVAGYGAQCAPIQMIEVSVCHQHEIDGREVVQLNPRMLDPLDHLEPFCPIGVNEHTVLGSLNEKGRVADPCDAELAGRELGKDRLYFVSLSSDKQRRNNDF